MSTILRYLESSLSSPSVSVELNDREPFFLARLNMGGMGVAATWFDAPGVDGAELASASSPLSMIEAEIHIARQTSVDDVLEAWADLVTELTKDRNEMEYQPNGASSSQTFDTFRATIPSLDSGGLSTFLERRTKEPLTLLIPRWPVDHSGNPIL